MKNPFAPLMNMYRRPSPQAVASDDLYDAEHSLLEALKDREWAEARIAAYEARLQRLRVYIIKGEAA